MNWEMELIKKLDFKMKSNIWILNRVQSWILNLGSEWETWFENLEWHGIGFKNWNLDLEFEWNWIQDLESKMVFGSEIWDPR